MTERPFSFLAYRGDQFGGCAWGRLADDEIKSFALDMLTAGYDIKCVATKAEHQAEIDRLRP